MSSLQDDFEDIWAGGDNEFHRAWSEQASAKHAAPSLAAANALNKIYPNHSLVMTTQDVLRLPEVHSTRMTDAPLLTTTRVALVSRGWLLGFNIYVMHFVLHEGPNEHPRALVLAAGIYDQDLHEEIWVFNQGFWTKSHALWLDVQSADWKDVILTDEFKTALKKDVYGFFKSEPIYKELAIPWKRGIIMWGPPGNGKTISIKVIMKTCDALGFAPLYVKSFQSFWGEETSMQDVFTKARQLAPCVMVLEDLDALINDRNRSFFFNQLDGLQGNDGLLVIGTTNHLDRLDPGLSSRPSRFDRKYLFDDPSRDARLLYAKWWQDKLQNNTAIDYPDALVEEVADTTAGFSFAYLKEAFVSCLVTLAGWEGDDKPAFSDALRKQIKMLRKQLESVQN
ncbi:P-loop containing nucleoside triphosphate hydrolase protein [Roridomyces roridus]|uniref:P-loop containing nucleoside triphosphate hydrolase protein n=1 Tax=Roridomyces roridus TaxID=1738132 RepID=A0AAD7BDP8_9AGAR|nr:P-loop containing nucleoside triphosphate hydrolase protein [Roridomyces roridus]